MNLTGSEKNIISYLLDGREATRYEVKKELEMAYGTVHGSFKSLEEKGLIRKVREERTKKGTMKTYFCLTPLGILRATSERIKSLRPEKVPISFENEEGEEITQEFSPAELATWEDLPKFVEEKLDQEFLEELDKYEKEEKAYLDELREITGKYGDSLPLILGKWDFFEDQGIESFITLRILRAPSELDWEDLAEKAKTRNRDTAEILARAFYSQLLSRYENPETIILDLPQGIPGLGEETKSRTFAEIAIPLADDPDLAPMVKQQVKELYDKEKREYKTIRLLWDKLLEAGK